jgi:hypothetical protein
MLMADSDRRASYLARRRADRREYWLIFCVAYPLLLAAAIVSRLFGVRSFDNERRSVFSEARVAAASCIPFVSR